MFFYRWHPQLALRYLPIVKFIKSLKLENPKILEVGSGSLGIGPYLKQAFTGVDQEFSGPQWPQMKQVKSKAQKLPFAEDEFDVAINVDVLEHLPKNNRQKVVAELFRVARRAVVIAVPCGQLAISQDKQLDKLYSRTFAQKFAFLKEHLKYGLPEEDQVRNWIIQAAKKARKEIKIQQQGSRNLNLRLWLMKGWITKNSLVDLFFRKILLLFLPLLSLIDRKPPHYRQIFFVAIRNSIN